MTSNNRMPVLFIGHGSPMNAIEDNEYSWAVKFDASLKKWILAGEHEQVVHYERHGKPAELSINLAEHYLPLRYGLGASREGDAVEFYNEQVVMGTISIRCVKLE